MYAGIPERITRILQKFHSDRVKISHYCKQQTVIFAIFKSAQG
jgi:hypothetical protein